MSYGVALRNGVPFTLGTIAALCVNATGSVAWSPADLVSLGAWYDPSDLTTMFQDAAGTTPVTAAGQPVGLILDKSGNGYHASQSTSTARPLFQVDGSGHCYLAFDGVDDCLNTDAIDLTGTSQATLFVGADVLSASVAMFLETSSNAFGNDGAFYVTSNERNDYVSTFLGGGNTASMNYLTSDPPAHTVTTAELNSIFTAGVDFAKVRVDSVSQSMGVDYASTSTSNFGNWPLHICSRDGSSVFCNVNLYSLIIGLQAYDAATVLEAETWVADKSGVTL